MVCCASCAAPCDLKGGTTLQTEVRRDLDELTHRSIGCRLLLGIASLFGFAWTDQFLVPEGSRLHWLATGI